METDLQPSPIREIGSGTSRYLPYIDGLRAIAVLSVIAYHLNHAWLPGGFLGVDVFFVISGFVVSASVSSLRAKHVLGRMVAFYARRFIRIMPALLVMLLITTLVTALIIPPAWLSLNIERTGILAFFGVSNFFLRNTSNDYFSLHSTFNPYTHTWSLGVEEQFYFVFPVLFLATSLVKRLERFAPLIFLGGFLVSVAYAMTRGVSDPVNAFYMITSRFWELAAGVLLFQLLSAKKWVPGRKLQGPTWLFRWGSAAMLAFLALSLIYPHFGPVPAPGSFLAVVATVGLLGLCLGLPPATGVRRFLELPVMQRIGKLSYSLYLWHWPVFVFFRWTIGLQSVLQILSALLITTFLASLSYWAVEHRLRRSERVKRAPRLLVVGVALVSVVASATLATVINRHTGDLTLSTVARNAADWYPDASTTSSAFPGCAVTIKSRVLQVASPLEYPVAIETLTRSGCSSPVTGPRVIVLGDSHAVAYEPILFDYVLRTGASVIFSAEPSCGFVSFATTEVDPKCLEHRALLSSTILRVVKAGDVLFLPSLRLPRFSDQDQAVVTSVIRNEIFGRDGVAARKAGAKFGVDFVARAEAKGARIVFEGVPPILRTPNFRCADWYDRTNPVCRGGATLNRQLLEEFRAPTMHEIAKLTSNSTAGSIWDPFPILCPPAETQCPAYSDNKPLYFDGDHLSGYSNQLLRESLESALVGAGKTP